MSDNLKNDILKAAADSGRITTGTLKETTDTPAFKNPQILQHSLDKSLKILKASRDTDKE